MQKVKALDHIADASGMIVDDGAATPGQASASSDLAGASASAATSSLPRDEVVKSVSGATSSMALVEETEVAQSMVQARVGTFGAGFDDAEVMSLPSTLTKPTMLGLFLRKAVPASTTKILISLRLMEWIVRMPYALRRSVHQMMCQLTCSKQRPGPLGLCAWMMILGQNSTLQMLSWKTGAWHVFSMEALGVSAVRNVASAAHIPRVGRQNMGS